MRLLLDSHILLWWMTDDAQLSAESRRAIRDTQEVFVSAATIWEIVIKRARGGLTMLDDIDVRADVSDESFITELPITWEHALAVSALPSHHKDPFDRMLIAQAQVEGLTLVTRDSVIAKYDVPVLRA